MSNSNVIIFPVRAPSGSMQEAIEADEQAKAQKAQNQASRNIVDDAVVVEKPVVSREKTLDYAGKASDFFVIEKEPMFSTYGEIQNRKVLYVNEKPINQVSNDFQIHQPIDIYRRFESVSKSHGLEINRVITNPANGGLLISARFSQMEIVGETHDINLSFYTAHDSRYRTFMSVDLLKLMCFNQVPTLYRNNERFVISEKHYRNALDYNVIDEALINIPAVIYAYEEKATQMKDFKFSMKDFIEFYINSYKVDTEAKKFNEKVKNLKDVYYNAAGQKYIGDNLYKAWNAITFMNTHQVKKTAMVEENRLIKNGNDSLKQLDRLLAIA